MAQLSQCGCLSVYKQQLHLLQHPWKDVLSPPLVLTLLPFAETPCTSTQAFVDGFLMLLSLQSKLFLQTDQVQTNPKLNGLRPGRTTNAELRNLTACDSTAVKELLTVLLLTGMLQFLPHVIHPMSPNACCKTNSLLIRAAPQRWSQTVPKSPFPPSSTLIQQQAGSCLMNTLPGGRKEKNCLFVIFDRSNRT